MKLEKGMYVRFNRGGIRVGKLIENINDSKFWKLDIHQDILEGDILKASNNIIDLIEVGDVIALKENIDRFSQVFILGIYEPALLREIKEKISKDELRIVRILTYEEFENRSYKVD